MCLQFKSFENTRKDEVARNKQFLLFKQYFLSSFAWIFCHFHQIWNCCLQTLSVWDYLKFVVWERVKKRFLQGFRCRSPVAPNAKIFNKWLQNRSTGNLLATSNIYKRLLKDRKLNITNMCQVGWMHAPLFITGNQGGVSSVEKVIIMLICLSIVDW